MYSPDLINQKKYLGSLYVVVVVAAAAAAAFVVLVVVVVVVGEFNNQH
jgi:hypothetical protein